MSQMMQQIYTAHGNNLKGEWACESDVYRIWDKCIKFYSIDSGYIEQYHELQTYLSQFTWTIILKTPTLIHPRFIQADTHKSAPYLSMKQITFHCLSCPEYVSQAWDINDRSRSWSIAELPFQEWKTLKDMFYDLAESGDDADSEILGLFFQQDGIIDQIRAFYNAKSLKTAIHTWMDRSQLVWINIKIAWFDHEKWELSLVITDIWRDIVQLINDNQVMIHGIVQAKHVH